MATVNATRTLRQRRANVGEDHFLSEMARLSPRLSDSQKEYILSFLQEFIALPDSQRTAERLLEIALKFAPEYGIEAKIVELLKANLHKEVANG